jgi:hypothetical protein
MRALGVLAAAALLAGITGCAVDPPAALPTPTAESPTATPTPTPVDPVAELVLSVADVQVLDGEGATTLRVPLAAWSEELLDLLTDHLGAPTVTEGEGNPHQAGATSHTWDGLSLNNTHWSDGDRLVVVASTGLPEGITVRTAGGVTLQSTDEQLVPLAVAPIQEYSYDGTDWSYFLIEGERLDPSIDPCAERAVPVIEVIYDRTQDRVSSIVSPSSTCQL